MWAHSFENEGWPFNKAHLTFTHSPYTVTMPTMQQDNVQCHVHVHVHVQYILEYMYMVHVTVDVYVHVHV